MASRSPEGASGRIRLHLPDGWTDGPLEAVYEVAGRSAATGEGGTAGEGAATATATATVPFTFRVPEHVAQGSYRVRLTAASADPADRSAAADPADRSAASAASDWTLEDGGVIDTCCRSWICRPPRVPCGSTAISPTGRGSRRTPLLRVTSGRVRCRAAMTTAAQRSV